MKPSVTRIDKSVELPRIVVGEKSVRPIAQLKGWYAATDKVDYAGGGAALCLVPTAVVVEQGDETHRVEIVDPHHNPLRKIVLSGLIVSGVCLLTMLVGSRIIKRRARAR